ncbi:MAG: PEP-CTERM sorting domain-containing protein [Candidatus Sulfopaludibacter sp.]|nr:PEP-CTERM sorting domain-containing protein [Candidatus Sulfopaludibacter sp.]
MIRQTLLCLLALTGLASASPLTFSVNGSFADGATFSGTFQYDGSTQTILSSNIATTTASQTGTTYSSSGSGSPWIQVGDSNDFSFEFQSTNHIFFFFVNGDPSTFTGGAIEDNPPCACTPSREYDFTSGFNFRLVSEGTVTEVASTPEPGSWVLLASALVAVLTLRRRAGTPA